MQWFLDFITDHRGYMLALLLCNLVLADGLILKFSSLTNRAQREALSERLRYIPAYQAAGSYVRMLLQGTVERYEKRKKKHGLYEKAAARLKKANYTGRYSVYVYMIFQYLLPLVLTFLAWLLSTSIVRALAVMALAAATPAYVVWIRRRRLSLKFAKESYKIYKYLHNQLSSGVHPYDAISTAHEVIEDKDIRHYLIILASTYEMTKDIHLALKDFLSRVQSEDAEALAEALRQGIQTGENKKTLQRQEKLMFHRYLDYIKAETDACRMKSALAAVAFMLVVVIMICIPLLGEVEAGVKSIFMY